MIYKTYLEPNINSRLQLNSKYRIEGQKVKGRISELIDISVGFGFWCDK